MNAIGELSLTLAILAATASLAASLATARLGLAWLLNVARGCLIATAAALIAASAVLVAALVGGHFEIAYVAQFTDRALPLGYKLAAFWAGEEGSLLLWAVLLSIMSATVALSIRFKSPSQSAATIGILAAVCAFFGFLLLLAADPFAVSSTVPADGNGLNPLLRDPEMIAHPPILFLGYAAFTIPFALMAGALLANVRDSRWAELARAWAIFAWVALSGGILLGAKWAYEVLGWGGYWAWDPVESASLLPWLTGIAAMHSLIVQRQRGMFRVWSAALLSLTFLLCIFGTYITRSGIVDSVHGFAQSLVGTFFLVFILTVAAAAIALLIWRRQLLFSDHQLSGLLSRDGFFLAANILLVAMTAVVLIGTMFTVISGLFSPSKTTLQPRFYNHVVGPMGLLLAGLMSSGPLLTYGQSAARHLVRGLVLPGIIALLAAASVYLLGIYSPWAIACAAIAGAVVTSVAVDLLRQGGAILTNHRRSGAQLTHIGVAMVIVGVTGSSVFSQQQTYQLNPGDSVKFAGMKLTLGNLSQDVTGSCTTVGADIDVSDQNGNQFTLHPMRRFFQNWDDQPNSVVAIQSTWTRDLYVTLAGWDQDGNNVALQAIVNPLVCWIWIGGCVLIAGGVVCLMPRLRPVAAVSTKAALIGSVS